MTDLALLRANLTNDKAESLILSRWDWEEHYGFDVDNIDAYESLEFHLWTDEVSKKRAITCFCSAPSLCVVHETVSQRLGPE